MVDLGGSLAVASRGLFATGVSTDLNGTTVVLFFIIQNCKYTDFNIRVVTYLSSGGKIGDKIMAVCFFSFSFLERDSWTNL
jgi:acyl-coenzyme A thioesterase 13